MHESNVEFSRNSWIRILRTTSNLTIEQYLEKLRGLVLLAKEHDSGDLGELRPWRCGFNKRNEQRSY